MPPYELTAAQPPYLRLEHLQAGVVHAPQVVPNHEWRLEEGPQRKVGALLLGPQLQARVAHCSPQQWLQAGRYVGWERRNCFRYATPHSRQRPMLTSAPNTPHPIPPAPHLTVQHVQVIPSPVGPRKAAKANVVFQNLYNAVPAGVDVLRGAAGCSTAHAVFERDGGQWAMYGVGLCLQLGTRTRGVHAVKQARRRWALHSCQLITVSTPMTSHLCRSPAVADGGGP